MLIPYPLLSIPVPCALSLCQRLSRGAAPAQGVQGWAGKEEGYSKNPSKNQLGLREKEKGLWLLSPVPKVSPWPSWARCSRGRAGNFEVHREKNKDNFQAEMQQSEEAGGNVGLHQPLHGTFSNQFLSKKLLLPLLWGSVDLGSGNGAGIWVWS